MVQNRSGRRAMPPPEAPIWADLPGSRPRRQGLAVPLRARNRTGPRRAGCPAGATAAWREPGAILAQAILHSHCSTIATSRQSLVQALQGKSVRPGGLKGGRYGVRSATNRVLDYLPCSSQQGGAPSRGLLLPDFREQLRRRQEAAAAPPTVYEPGGASAICSLSFLLGSCPWPLRSASTHPLCKLPEDSPGTR